MGTKITRAAVLIACTGAVIGLNACAKRQKSAAPAATPASQATVKPAKQGASRTADSSEINPFNVGLTGEESASGGEIPPSYVYESHAERMALTPGGARSNSSPDAHLAFMSDVLAGRGVDEQAINPLKAGGANFSQVSFSMEGADFDPCMSPDGSRIAYASTQHSHTADIYVKDVGSRTVTQLTRSPAHDVMPSVSPDGTRIAFASNRTGNWDIFVMPVDGGKAVQITTQSSHELHPSWSPDGGQLTFCRLGDVSGRWEIWVIDTYNAGLAHFLGYGLFPEWCPVPGTGDGGATQILFQRSKSRGDRAFGVWTMDYLNGEAMKPTEIISSPIAACITPTWSPDGQWITFSAVPNPNQWAQMTEARPDSANLWMINRDGTGLVNLTANGAVNLMPTWARGNRIYFISDRNGVDNIWSLATDGAIMAATGKYPVDSTQYTNVIVDDDR